MFESVKNIIFFLIYFKNKKSVVFTIQNKLVSLIILHLKFKNQKLNNYSKLKYAYSSF